MGSRARRVAYAAFSLLASQHSAAQGASATSQFEPAHCLGFSFGTWTPALSWQSAGHGALVDSSLVPRAPDGRGWAVPEREPQSDSTLVLFPSWWPAGIVVVLERPPSAPRDTVAGRATAIVADGRKASPTSLVRAWYARCGAVRD